MQKRGVSSIIATFLIVMVAIIAVSLSWTLVSNLIKETQEKSEIQTKFLETRLSIIRSSIQTLEDGTLTFLVERDQGGADIEGFLITLTDTNSNVVTIDKYSSTPLAVLERFRVEITQEEQSGLENIARIEVFGIVMSKITQEPIISNQPLTTVDLLEINKAGDGGGGPSQDNGPSNEGGNPNPEIPPQLCDCPNGICDGLILHLDFENESNRLQDCSPYNHQLETFGNGKFSNSGFVSDGNDYLQIPGDNPTLEDSPFNTDLTEEMTFSFTIKSNDYDPLQYFFSRRDSGGHGFGENNGHFSIGVSGNRVILRTYDNQAPVAGRLMDSSTLLQNGQPYNITFVTKWNGPGSKLYINGIDTCISGTSFTNCTDKLVSFDPATFRGDPVIIGAAAKLTTTPQPFPPATPPQIINNFTGTIDNIRVWNRELTPIEINPACAGQTTLTNDYVELTFGGCKDGYGYVTDLSYNGVEYLRESSPFTEIKLNDGTWIKSNSIIPLGNNIYKIGFGQHGGINYEFNVKITPHSKYFEFEIVDMMQDTTQINTIDFMHISSTNGPGDKTWALNAPDNALFIGAFPLNFDTSCAGEPDGSRSQYGHGQWRCSTDPNLDMVGAKGAFMTTTKAEFFSTIKQIALDHPGEVPYITDENGEWFRTSTLHEESYLFAVVTPSNYVALADYARRGKFPNFLAIDPLRRGSYAQPFLFPNLAALKTALDTIKGNNQVKIGIHTFFNQVYFNDGLVNFANPGPEGSLSNQLFSIPLAHLDQDMNPTDTTITLDIDPTTNSYFDTYFYSRSIWSDTLTEFIIGNEIIQCTTQNANLLGNCVRSIEGTPKTPHPEGTQVYMTIKDQFRTYMLNKDNNLIREQSAQGFASAFSQLGASFMYVDGEVFKMAPPDMSISLARIYKHKIGFVHYLNEITNSVGVNYIQLGGGAPSIGWFYVDRSASDDGGVYKKKQYTEAKVQTILDYNPYQMIRPEMGWWKFSGAKYSDGKWDFEASTFDDVHYAMTKIAVLDNSVGLQLGSFYDSHARIGELFDLVGLYHQLMEDDRQSSIIPQNIKTYLSAIDKEAELNHISGWNFVEKNMNIQNDASWDQSNHYIFTIDNPFGSQPPNIEIRPNFDYYDYSDAQNMLITDFSNPFEIKTSTGATCTIDSNGNVQVVNSAAVVGGCKLTLNGPFDFTNKRGFGLSITGNSKDELVVLRLDQTFFRDFKTQIDFTGQRDIIFAEATGDNQDIIKGVNTFWEPFSPRYRHWDMDYSRISKISIYINNVEPGTTSNLQFHGLKALQEKGQGEVVNPSVKIGSKTMTFPVTLKMDDTSPHIISYNGRTGDYNIYTSNHALLSSGTIAAANRPTLASGANTVEFYSDVSNFLYSKRGDIRISSYDDEDGDGIPTDGSFGLGTICTGTNNFCNDNNPGVYNPTQS